MWSYGLVLDQEKSLIMSKVLEQTKTGIDSDYMGSWSAFDGSITYSLPLVDHHGHTFGIIGTTVSRDRIYNTLPTNDDGDGYGYFLASSNDETNQMTPVITNGTTQKTIAPLHKGIKMSKTKNDNSGIIDTVYGPVAIHFDELKIYSSNNPFELQKLYICGIINEAELTQFSSDFQRNMIFAIMASLLFGIVVAFIMGRFLASPINKLTTEIGKVEKNNLKKLSTTGIQELDKIGDSIMQMTTSLTNSLSKTDIILDSLHMGVGTFEYCQGNEYVTVSSRLFDILNISSKDKNGDKIKYTNFIDIINDIQSRPEAGLDNNYQLKKNKWVQIISSYEDNIWWGVILDTTNEVLEKRASAYKVDYDQLTGIYNRGAFIRRSTEILKDRNQKNIALAMFDLDNLKYLNDNFGHDIGDDYIRNTARIMQEKLGDCAIVARISGDEFVVLFYNAKNKQEIVDRIDGFYIDLEKNPIILSNSSEFKIRISCGLAWFKEDADNLDELIRYADFAMYQVKHDTKGEMKMYDKKKYLTESFLVNGGEELNNILENGLIDFHFQPIIHANSGEVYGYEALMRPQSKLLNTPYKLLKIATAQSKLTKVEQVTFYNALEAYRNNQSIEKNNTKLFINSIPNKALKDIEYDQLEEKYGMLLNNLIVEIIENEQLDVETLGIKTKRVSKWGGQLALDDYGSGYSGDNNLLIIKPDIVKVDSSVIYAIERDTSRQAILAKIISFCHERKIKVVAEGVETKEQLDYLIESGVDLLQGYYIARPQQYVTYNKKVLEQYRNK